MDYEDEEEDDEDEGSMDDVKQRRKTNADGSEQREQGANEFGEPEEDDETPAELRVLLKDPKALLHRASDVLRKKFGSFLYIRLKMKNINKKFSYLHINYMIFSFTF